MSNELEHRLVELETRVSFQEHALGELSDALAAARDEEARNALLLHRALEELKQLRGALSANPMSADPAAEPPPPHY
ncbi:SlyX family protein [Novilysobacter erysipheiresistens]|uniref:Protein SlyX homolog n=1 Tax=Novilysobacter erysipheiresistens TaxID=1749332 RepID=A0ABU7Z0K6_9GAMM